MRVRVTVSDAIMTAIGLAETHEAEVHRVLHFATFHLRGVASCPAEGHPGVPA